MADFVAVLKKTIDGLGETTPDTRARVYEKARATISAKLAALSPQPAPSVIERQKAALEQAIKAIEAEYADNSPPVDDFEAVMASLAAPVEVALPPLGDARAQSLAAKSVGAAGPAPAPAAPPQPPAAAVETPRVPAADRLAAEAPLGKSSAPVPPSKGRLGLAIVALIVLVFAGVAGYALWLNRDEVAAMTGLGTTPAQDEAATPESPASDEEPKPEVAAVEPVAPPVAEQPAAAPAPAAVPAVQKFTQKLNSDGTETDEGPAGGTPGVGEGNSVAALTVPPPEQAPSTAPADAPAPAGETPTVDQAAEATPAAEPSAPAPSEPAAAVPVGQRAIFYEERTSNSGGSAEAGSTVWSIVQESPGGDKPPEAAIRADVSVPGKEIQLRMTVRRNGDPTLPASHIIELIFLTPDNFEGGVIDNLLRMTMKETEEATGNPLLGVPAKIGDGFFLIALSDGKAESEANMQLFRRMKWIDIPIVYRSGRRALMTLERGIPGDKVFEEALRAWSQPNG
jgi:hypothetical protein